MDAADWDERYAGSGLVWSAGPNEFVERDLADLAPGRALDLACGEGRNARWLASRGWQVTALDFSAVAVDKGRAAAEQQGLGIDWRVGDALSAPLPEDLDLVVVAYLHLPPHQRTTVVRRAAAALAPGGHLHLVGHDLTNLTEGVGGPQDASVLCTAADVIADLRDGPAAVPVEVLHADRVPRTVAAADGHGPAGTAWDVLVHVRRTS